MNAHTFYSINRNGVILLDCIRLICLSGIQEQDASILFFWVDHSELEKQNMFFQLKNIITQGITGWSRLGALNLIEVRHLDEPPSPYYCEILGENWVNCKNILPGNAEENLQRRLFDFIQK